MYTAGAVFVLAACTVGFALQPSLLRAPGVVALDAKAGLALAYATVLSSALNYALITWAGQRLEPSTISLWASGQGAFTILLALLAFGSPPSALQLAGGLLIILGLVICVTVSIREEARERRARLLPPGTERCDSAEGVGEACAGADIDPVSTSTLSRPPLCSVTA